MRPRFQADADFNEEIVSALLRIHPDEALLERLSWPDNPESRLSIMEAIERYYSTAYLRTRKS